MKFFAICKHLYYELSQLKKKIYCRQYHHIKTFILSSLFLVYSVAIVLKFFIKTRTSSWVYNKLAMSTQWYLINENWLTTHSSNQTSRPCLTSNNTMSPTTYPCMGVWAQSVLWSYNAFLCVWFVMSVYWMRLSG